MNYSEEDGPSSVIENKFILDALASRLFPNVPFPDPSPDLDWHRLLSLLRLHRLSAHFYVLGRSKRVNWPAFFRESLRQDRYGLIIYSEQLLERIKPVLIALQNAAIPVMVFKGWALIQTLYEGDYGQRVYSDIDILIRPKDVDTAEKILKSLDWHGSDEPRPGFIRYYYNAQAYYFFEHSEKGGPIYNLGFHWGLLHHPAYNPEQIDVYELFKRGIPLKIAGLPVLEMSIDDYLVYSCAHIVLQHQTDNFLLPFYETAALINKAGESIEWRKVGEYARQWRLIVPLVNVMKKIDEFWPGVVPSQAVTTILGLKPSVGEQLLKLWFESSISTNFDYFLTCLTMSGIRRRFSFIFETIFPNLGYMKINYGIPPISFWPLLYLRRFIHVLRLSFVQSKGKSFKRRKNHKI